MSFRLYWFILFIILSSSSLSTLLLFFYMNPETNRSLAMSLMGVSVFLMSSSLLAFLIFFLKRLYLRGDVQLATMHRSLRQAIGLSLGGITTVSLYAFGIAESRLILMVWMTIACFEVMMQAIE